MSAHDPNKITVRLELEFHKGNQFQTPVNKGLKIQSVGNVQISASQFVQLYMDHETGMLYAYDGTYWSECRQFQRKYVPPAERKAARRNKPRSSDTGPDYGVD